MSKFISRESALTGIAIRAGDPTETEEAAEHVQYLVGDVIDIIALTEPQEVDENFVLRALLSLRKKDLPQVMGGMRLSMYEGLPADRRPVVESAVDGVYKHAVGSHEVDTTEGYGEDEQLFVQAAAHLREGEALESAARLRQIANHLASDVQSVNALLAEEFGDSYEASLQRATVELEPSQLASEIRQLNEDIKAQGQYSIDLDRVAEKKAERKYPGLWSSDIDMDRRQQGQSQINAIMVERNSLVITPDAAEQSSQRLQRIKATAELLETVSSESWLALAKTADTEPGSFTYTSTADYGEIFRAYVGLKDEDTQDLVANFVQAFEGERVDSDSDVPYELLIRYRTPEFARTIHLAHKRLIELCGLDHRKSHTARLSSDAWLSLVSLEDQLRVVTKQALKEAMPPFA